MMNYGHHWRIVTRPRILARAGGVFADGRYLGGARCERCFAPDAYPLNVFQRSELDIAHLDGDREDDDALAALCRPCHRAHDYNDWARKFGAWVREKHAKRIAALDAGRPLLVMLQEHE